MDLTRSNVISLQQPLFEVWNAIGYDMYDVCGDNIDPEEVIEACIDANRLTIFVSNVSEGKAADQLVKQLIAKHGYHKVVDFLAQQFPMC